MKQVARLSTVKTYRKYNERVLNKLSNAGIEFELKSLNYGYGVMVADEDEVRASKLILSIAYF